jgi:predicted short-subunit dehydrogenase-like oxidoreductase (DUF2520 family)
MELRVGVIGAGRVGAVLASALRSAGHQVVAVGGESNASRTRIETMLPGVPVAKPTAVAKAADLLLLTVPDDALDNVVRMLVASGAIHSGQYVVHTSGRHGLEILEPAAAIGARPIAMHPAMTFTGTDLDLPRLADCAFGVTAAPAERPVAAQLVDDFRGRIVWIDEENRTLYHAALAHGANHLVTLVSEAMELLRSAGSDDPAATLRPLLSAALDNTLTYGDAALTGPIMRGDVETVRAHLASIALNKPSTLASYVAMARATAEHVVADGRLEPRRADEILALLDAAVLDPRPGRPA